MGIIPYLHCPHYDEPERAGFDKFYSGQITDAIAIENQVAIVWNNYEFHLMKFESYEKCIYVFLERYWFEQKSFILRLYTWRKRI